MDYRKALPIAEQIVDYLRPACERISIAGSLRRKRPFIGDIEIVCKPLFTPFEAFEPKVSQAIREGLLERGPASTAMAKAPDGPRYKRLAYRATGVWIQVDVFIVRPPADFGVIYAIRTGSSTYSHWLVTQALLKGMKVSEGQLFRLTPKTELIRCPEEEGFFRVLGVPCLPPEKRER